VLINRVLSMTTNIYQHWLSCSVLIQIDVSHDFFLVGDSSAKKDVRYLDSYENFTKNTACVYFYIQDNILKNNFENLDFEPLKKFSLWHHSICILITSYTSETPCICPSRLSK